jgi:hypothetical protein
MWVNGDRYGDQAQIPVAKPKYARIVLEVKDLPRSECKQCRGLVPEGFVEDHLTYCPAGMRYCPLNCGVSFQRSEWTTHMLTCPKYIVNCGYFATRSDPNAGDVVLALATSYYETTWKMQDMAARSCIQTCRECNGVRMYESMKDRKFLSAYEHKYYPYVYATKPFFDCPNTLLDWLANVSGKSPNSSLDCEATFYQSTFSPQFDDTHRCYADQHDAKQKRSYFHYSAHTDDEKVELQREGLFGLVYKFFLYGTLSQEPHLMKLFLDNTGTTDLDNSDQQYNPAFITALNLYHATYVLKPLTDVLHRDVAGVIQSYLMPTKLDLQTLSRFETSKKRIRSRLYTQ